MKKHIMIVDDDKLNLVTARGILKDKFEVSAANSGELALTLLERSIPDLILLDIMMPQMSGLEVMDRMQSHPLWRSIPIIFLTADDNVSQEAECLRRGAADFIHKPFEVEVMIARINRTLRNVEDRKELERQWQNIHNMVSVEQVLFDAHRTNNGIEMAMQLICESESAKRAFIIEKSNDTYTCVSEWCADKSGDCFRVGERIDAQPFLTWMEQLQNHLPVSIPDVEEIKDQKASYDFLKSRDVNNFVAAPIYFSDNTFYGFLGVDNPGLNFHSVDMLCFMSLGFSMAFENLEEHKRIERMGMYDFDTGVLNRNSYFNYIHNYEQNEGDCLGCVFIDVNGLHEYNNKYGHELGDKMLESIAGILTKQFGHGKVYRIGGDEFVVLVENSSKDEIKNTMTSADSQIEEKGYSVSYGIDWSDKEIDITEMVKIADSYMYDAKALHYSKQENDRRTVR